MNSKKLISKFIGNAVVWIISLVMLVPIGMILLNSFKTKGEALKMSFSLPKNLIWENFSIVIDRGNLLTSFFNSMLYSVTSVAIIVLFATMASFVVSRNRTPFNKSMYLFIVLGMTLNINHIALMKIMQWTNLLNTRAGIILIYSALQIPFAVFMIYNFVSTVPKELDEAAFLDGADPLHLFFNIIFPLLKPAVISVGILSFLNSWNEFILPLYYLNDSNLWPMTNSVYNFFGRYSASWNLVSADMLLTCVPVVFIYLVGQKYLLSGITAGAVKG